MSIIESISERILELTQAEKMTLNQLALVSDISYSTLHNIVKLKVKNVSVLTIARICEVFDISLSEFFDSPSFINHGEGNK